MAILGPELSNTTILSLKYRFPSDQRSQRASGNLSSSLGDDERKGCVVFTLLRFLPLFCRFLRI